MPSVAWKVAAAAAASGAAVNHPSSRYNLVGDGSSSVAGRYLFNMHLESHKGMPFDEKDLESKQTLWVLYDRWRSYFDVSRCSVEKGYRFNIFKERVHSIYQRESADLSSKLELNYLCDVSIDEICPPKRFPRRR